MSSNLVYDLLEMANDQGSSGEIGKFLQSVRERRGLRRAAVAAALDMGEQNIRYYESGRNRLPAEDIPRFVDAYQMTQSEREQFARLLALIDEDGSVEPRTLTDDEQAELEELRRHPELNVQFLNLSRTYDDLSDEDRRGLLEALRFFARARGIPTAE